MRFTPNEQYCKTMQIYTYSESSAFSLTKTQKLHLYRSICAKNLTFGHHRAANEQKYEK